jgi:5-(carboxyamino)imidazole ribonucleotide mutase
MVLDSLLSIVQMPAGVPVATLAIGKAGATNAGLISNANFGRSVSSSFYKPIDDFRQQQTDKVLANPIPGVVA